MFESDILIAVLDLLAACRVVAWRMNTGCVKLDDRFVKFAVPGFSDVLAIPTVKGKFKGIPCCWCEPWFIETKSPTGRQTAEQRSFERQVKDTGAQYFIIRDPDELKAHLRRHGVIE